MKGSLTTLRYRVATVFVDHFSDLGFVFLQRSTTAAETLQAKHAFERFAGSHNVTIRHYHADNGRFAEKTFVDDVEQKNQTISFCGVSAHHQNGKAEKRIRDLQDVARTMLIHAYRRWPKGITVNLWPHALRTANDVRNCVAARDDGQSPMSVFTGVPVQPQLRNFHPFGCPVYVLDKALQNRKKIPKWNERARIGIYLGHSPSHARNVSLVLNLLTGLVSPQFHVQHDDGFTTVRDGSDPPLSLWQQLAGFVVNGSSRNASPVVPPNEGAHALVAPERHDVPPNAAPNDVPPAEGVANVPIDDQPAYIDDAPHDLPLPVAEPAANAPIPQPTRRSSRIPTPSRRLLESLETTHIAFEAQVMLDLMQELDIDLIHPFAFAASNDPDTMYIDQALREPDRAEFLKAMQEEINAHETRGHWVLVRRDTLPPGTVILPAVWSMKRKRRIDTRQVYKWKARLTIHGGRQIHGVNYWDTYSPVVRWSLIRLVLVLSLQRGWHTRQLDFVLAYPQAPVECDMYMEIPRGFVVSGGHRKAYALKLLQNLYGQKQAGRVWNQYLTKLLLANGFLQSEIDECVFYFKQCIMLVYVDDTLICGPTTEQVDEVIALLASLFDIEDQGDISDYLGVRVNHSADGTITLTQPHLIDQLIKDLNFQPNTKPVNTPSLSSKILQPDLDGPPLDETFHYRSIIGKLNFLEKSTRPDIAYYPVHQCARFTANPRASHGDALKRIVRYLLGTRDKGLEIRPSPPDAATFDCWVDADFVGNWSRSIAMDDIDTARSRTGYIILYAACAIIWAAKLQTEIAHSTTEAEYIALSTPFVKLFHSSICFKNCSVAQASNRLRNLPFIARYSKTILARLNWLQHRKCALALNTSMLSIITFANMSGAKRFAFRRSTRKINSVIYSPNPVQLTCLLSSARLLWVGMYLFVGKSMQTRE